MGSKGRDAYGYLMGGRTDTMMLGFLQVLAIVIGFVAVAFFAVFTGYYIRNRRIALRARTERESDSRRPT